MVSNNAFYFFFSIEETKIEQSQIDPKFNYTDFEFKFGDKYKILSGKIEPYALHTPSKIAEWELISEMDSKGIGTDASIPQHIKNIQSRGYISIKV